MCVQPLCMQRTALAEDDAEAMQAVDGDEEGQDGVWLEVVPAAVLSRIRVLLGAVHALHMCCMQQLVVHVPHAIRF